MAIAVPSVPVDAIQNGVVDTSHPYVCLVVFYDANDMPLRRTTGVLVSEKVIVTAGHGTYGTAKARAWFLSEIPPAMSWLDPQNTPRPEGYPWGGPDSWEGTPYTNPEYQSIPGNGLPNADYHDVGVVVLKDACPIQGGVLPTAGFVDSLPGTSNNLVDLVGYGVNYQERGLGVPSAYTWQWLGQRFFAQAKLVKSQDILNSEFLKVTANPGQDKGGATFGDSGGPVLLGGTNLILGVNSFATNTNCDGVTYAQRIDLPDILEWIRSYTGK